MSTGKRSPAKLQGTPWHKEYIKKQENDPKRHKKWCIHYREDNYCGLGGKCSGSSHCLNYKNERLEAEKRKYKANKLPWQAQSTAHHLPNLVQVTDTVVLRDTVSNESFEITLPSDMTNVPTLYPLCLGKNIGDFLSLNEFTYQILQIRKSDGSAYTSPDYHKKTELNFHNPSLQAKSSSPSITNDTSPSPVHKPLLPSITDALVANYNNNSGLLTREQIPESLFVEWAQTMASLYHCCKVLSNQKLWSGVEAKTFPEFDQIYKHMSTLLNMIGPVNGYRLFANLELSDLLIAYARKKPYQDEICLAGRKKGKDIFRLRTENYLARKIITQQILPEKILLDNHKDRRLVHNLKRNERKPLRTSEDHSTSIHEVTSE